MAVNSPEYSDMARRQRKTAQAVAKRARLLVPRSVQYSTMLESMDYCRLYPSSAIPSVSGFQYSIVFHFICEHMPYAWKTCLLDGANIKQAQA